MMCNTFSTMRMPGISPSNRPMNKPNGLHANWVWRALLGLVLLLSLAPARAFAGVNPSVNWVLVYGSAWGDGDPVKSRAIATHFDIMRVGGNSSWVQYLHQYNPAFKAFRYDNFTNNNDGSDGDKLLWIQRNCVAQGIDYENMWVHFGSDMGIKVSGSPRDDSFSNVVIFDIDGYHDQTYWAYGDDAATNMPFMARNGDMVYIGYSGRFSTIDIKMKQLVGPGFTGTWEYCRNDSSWMLLNVSDSTNNLSQDGRVNFAPPADWGFSTINGNGHYWVRLRCTKTPSQPAKWAWIRKEKFYPPVHADGSYTVPGWNPLNDINGDGWVSDNEFLSRADKSASARFKYQSRVPTFYWYPERYVANPGAPNYRKFNAEWAVKTCTEDLPGGAHVDGIFEDNCIPKDGSIWPGTEVDTLYIGNHTITSGTQKVLEYPGIGPGRQFHIDHLIADSTVYAKLRPLGKILEGNCSQYYTDGHLYQYAPLSVHTIARGDSAGYFAYGIHSMAMREFWAIPSQCITIGGMDSPTVASRAQFQIAREQTSNGRMGEFAMRQSLEDANYGPTTMSYDRDRMFGLTYYCMVANPNSYGAWMTVGAISPPEVTQWWPAVGYDFGVPQNDSVYVYQTGTDSNGETFTVFARYFTKALVLVKPKPNWNSKFTDPLSPITVVNLPKAMQRLNLDGSVSAPATQISLRNIEGAIMLGTVNAPGTNGIVDTIPPSPTSLDYTFHVDDTSPPSQSIASTRAVIKVNLSDVIDKSSVTGSTVQVSGSVTGIHSGATSVVGRYLTFTPSNPFSNNEVVTVRVLGSLKSLTGRSLDGNGDGQPGGDKVWSFAAIDH